MPILEQLKFVELTPQIPKPIFKRRRTLIAAIDQQIVWAERFVDNHTKPSLDSLQCDTNGVPGLPTPSRLWWHETVDGKFVLTIRFLRRPLEFQKGKKGIECENAHGIVSALRLIRQATVDGELDALLSPKVRVDRVK